MARAGMADPPGAWALRRAGRVRGCAGRLDYRLDATGAPPGAWE